MCGIIAGITTKNILPILINGLEKLEYRGYDSAGVASLIDGQIHTVKTIGKINNLKTLLANQMEFQSSIGIGHTRWATHGAPHTKNAHPHSTDHVSVVHNGIIENYEEIKQDLQNAGYQFKSDTDTEVVANLLDYYFLLEKDFKIASYRTIARLEGSFALVFLFKEHQILFAACKKNPLVLGLSSTGTYIASDIIAFGTMLDQVVYLEDGDNIVVQLDDYIIFDKNNIIIDRPITFTSVAEEVSKKDYPHFMLKEIHEQPIVLNQTLSRYLEEKILSEIKINWQKIDSIKILACGSAYHAGLVAKYWLEEITNINVDLEIASEYRYRASANIKNRVTIIISQSGETLDTLEALKKIKITGETIIAITNVKMSSIARQADYVLPIMVGAEIGVASTKAFLGQLMVLAILSIEIGRQKGRITHSQFEEIKISLLSVPKKIQEILLNCENIKKIATQLKEYQSLLFIARGNLYPIALEGALKMKELSYIYSEGYAAGELKHGPIALIDNNMPVIALMPSSDLFDKIFSNAQEVIARGAKLLCIVDEENIDKVRNHSYWKFPINHCDQFIAPMIYTVPLQLLAYYIADMKGNDVDQPRNLAKSVTVE